MVCKEKALQKIGFCKALLGAKKRQNLLKVRASGKRIEKVDPLPGVDSMARVPPLWRRMCLTIASPRPVPPVARERPLSTR